MKYTRKKITTFITALIALLYLAGCSSEKGETHASHTHDSESVEHAHEESGHAHSEDSEHHDHPSSEEEGHDNDGEKKVAGPNGGRIITSVDPNFEFLVNDDRSVQLTFLDSENNPIKPNQQQISLLGGERSNPTMITFATAGSALVSSQPLPTGGIVPVVLQIANSASASIVREKFNVNLSECPECAYQEYACICAHEHDE